MVAASLMLDAVRAGCATGDSAAGSFALDGVFTVEVDADTARVQGGRPDPVLGPVEAGRRARGHLSRPGHVPGQGLTGQGTWAKAPEHLGYAGRFLATHRLFADLTWTPVEHALLTYGQALTATSATAVVEQSGQVITGLPQLARQPGPTPPDTRRTP